MDWSVPPWVAPRTITPSHGLSIIGQFLSGILSVRCENGQSVSPAACLLCGRKHSQQGASKPKSMRCAFLHLLLSSIPATIAGCPHLARFSRDVGYHRSSPQASFGPTGIHSVFFLGTRFSARNWKTYSTRNKLEGEARGIPRLAKNERDVGHPAVVVGIQPKSACRKGCALCLLCVLWGVNASKRHRLPAFRGQP